VRSFKPAWWLPSAHLQTVWPTLMRRKPVVALRRERWELPDGDFLDLDWTPADSGPIVIVLHGLEGSASSPYARGILHTIDAWGWRGLLMHFRGCSGEPNRLPRTYHSGETSDLDALVARIGTQYPGEPLAVIGYSVGGNVLLKWLGETGNGTHIRCAVAVSVPFDLHGAADRLERGVSRLYQWWLLSKLRASLQRKARLRLLPHAVGDLSRLHTFRAWDDRVTAPLHGFSGVEEYYTLASSRQYLKDIQTPTLILHARDDPFMTPEVIPGPSELSPPVTFELSERGGHVGFISGNIPGRPRYWLEDRIPRFLQAYLP